MSRALARGKKSYRTEARLFSKASEFLKSAGFQRVRPHKVAGVKLIDAIARDGKPVKFWIKLGWSGVPYAAVQFGMFRGREGSRKSNAEFVDFVANLVANIKARGATHALLFHTSGVALALPIDDVPEAYAAQMREFPREARNTKSPTMWFLDPRPRARPELTAIVRRRAIPLEVLANRGDVQADEPEARSRRAEVEARIAQSAFRQRVGNRCGWRCVVSGSSVREVLDAAHLPGRDWRRHNAADDGILVRADIHKLLDSGLASIRQGVFRLKPAAVREYGEFDGRRVT